MTTEEDRGEIWMDNKWKKVDENEGRKDEMREGTLNNLKLPLKTAGNEYIILKKK